MPEGSFSLFAYTPVSVGRGEFTLPERSWQYAATAGDRRPSWADTGYLYASRGSSLCDEVEFHLAQSGGGGWREVGPLTPREEQMKCVDCGKELTLEEARFIPKALELEGRRGVRRWPVCKNRDTCAEPKREAKMQERMGI